VSWSSSYFDEDELKPVADKLPSGTRLVVWHDGSINIPKNLDGIFVRDFSSSIETSCEFQDRTMLKVYSDEVEKVKYTFCSTVECVWALSRILSTETVHFSPASSKRKVEEAADLELVVAIKDERDFLDLLKRDSSRMETFSAGRRKDPTTCLRFSASSQFMSVQSCYKPGDRSCDDTCPRGWAYRADLRACVQGGPCSLLSSVACFDDHLFQRCKADCENAFHKEIRKHLTSRNTVTISLVTLFLLGCVLGLLFAKLYWVDPLLDENERLKHH